MIPTVPKFKIKKDKHIWVQQVQTNLNMTIDYILLNKSKTLFGVVKGPPHLLQICSNYSTNFKS